MRLFFGSILMAFAVVLFVIVFAVIIFHGFDDEGEGDEL